MSETSNNLLVTAPSAQIEMVMPAHVAAVMPFKDHEAFGRLTLDQKARVSQLLALFAEMKSAPDGVVACADRLGALNAMSGSNLVKLYYAFRKRGWRALAKIYKGPEKLPGEFVQYVRLAIENNSRGTAAALQALKDDWAAGKSVPGYGTWREYFAWRYPEQDVPERYPFGFFPDGWSDSNLYTKQSTRAERALIRQGYAAMKRYIPHVVRDTSKLRPLELITIDDFELDFLIRAFNPVRQRWEICRAAGLLAIDVATRRKLAIALVPRFKLSKKERERAAAHIAANADLVEGEAETTAEKRTRISITRHDVQCLLNTVFSMHGRPAEYGCTILCENASAAITADFELALELLIGVQVARTGLIADKTLKNGFVQGGGKPWEKGWIESLFNKLWNALGAMPGQKGSDYQGKPADHEAKVAYAMGLFKLDGLSPELASKLRVPFLTIDDALDGLNAVFSRIERRTDHRMLGFEERFMYRLPGTAGLVDELALVGLSQEQLIEAEAIPFRESPVERWERLMPLVRREKIADYMLACLLLTPKKVALRNHRLVFMHAGQSYTYADADSPVMKLDEGTELLGYYDAGRPGVLHVTDIKGRYVGPVRRRGAVDIRDYAAISEEAGEITRLIRSCVVGPVRERHALQDAQIPVDHAHNEALLRAANLLPDAPLPSASRAELPAPAGSAIGTGDNPASSCGTKPAERPASISRRLAAPARACAADGATLAQGIAEQLGRQDAGKARAEALQADDDLDSTQLL